MDLNLTEEQSDFRAVIERFLEKEVPTSTVREWADTAAGFDRDWWVRAAELGVAAPLVSENHGGGSVSGLGVLDLAMFAEEFGRVVAPGPLHATNIVLAGLMLAEDQNPAHGDLIEDLVGGGRIAAWAVSEPGLGWNPSGPTVSVDEGFVLNGVKDRVEYAAESDVLLVNALTAEGISLFVVPVDRPGVTVLPMQSLDLTRRYAQVTFDSVELVRTDLVGVLDEGEPIASHQTLIAGVLQSAETVGILRTVLDFTTEWAFDRYSFGRPLASYQALKHRFADIRTWVEASAAIASSAAHAVQDGDQAAAQMVAAAKSYVTDLAPRIIQDCVQLHGGIGVTWEHDLHLYLRRAVANRVTYGTPAEHRRRIADLIEL
ncbi:acyl-CoA dehydrogenase family protein [Gordonia rhizosphera]|uniref:Putative acyl-CoA dehydrogenase n=1 Tax=Gordonia rhizosphera NBRC 16068 TaxID=1108045 RepID=K6V0Y9_9ACTN|nr:acyl-CoA dehydrogenase family protein [Gordonia rhizosphera]GAB89573.1 putative acyl-CoA dehydrogenase [Gordonia rhizosphera NBRC 16068]